jgi:hypothetical protein
MICRGCFGCCAGVWGNDHHGEGAYGRWGYLVGDINTGTRCCVGAHLLTADILHIVEYPEPQDLAEQRKTSIIEEIADREVENRRSKRKIPLRIPSDGGSAVSRQTRNQGQPGRRVWQKSCLKPCCQMIDAQPGSFLVNRAQQERRGISEQPFAPSLDLRAATDWRCSSPGLSSTRRARIFCLSAP